MTARETTGSSMTSFNAITMISADRMKSVRIAPATVASSASTRPQPREGLVVVVVVADGVDQLVGALVGQVGAPPNMRMTSTRIGATALSSSAAGRMNRSLLRSEPTAICG